MSNQAPSEQPATRSEHPFVVFIHPDGRTLGAGIAELHSDMVADLVVLEGENAPFGGTRLFVGVPYVARKEGELPTPGSWHY